MRFAQNTRTSLKAMTKADGAIEFRESAGYLSRGISPMSATWVESEMLFGSDIVIPTTYNGTL
jgi:hypothetical protein